MVYCHFVYRGHGHIVNAYYCKGVLEKLIRVHIPHKRPEFQGNRFKLHHNNAPAHTAKIVRAFPKKKKVEVMLHPTYSLDIAHDFFLYPTLKKSLKGRIFSSIKGIETTVQSELQCMSKNAFEKVFSQGQKCWENCVRLGGKYIERVLDQQE